MQLGQTAFCLRLAMGWAENWIAFTASKMQTVLTYHDHTLYEEDLVLLKPPHWLNDKLIGFYYESLLSSRPLELTSAI